MSRQPASCPASREQVVSQYFLEHRAKVIDIAAFLDRYDRAEGEGDDFRVEALRRAIEILGDGRPARARRVLEALSDMSSEPIPDATGLKGAFGACPPADGGAS